MLSCLIVRPAVSVDANGGDTVVYRKVERYLSARMRVEVLELTPTSRVEQALTVARGAPPEAARYGGAANRAALSARLEAGRHDVVLFAHEAAFPLSVGVAAGGPKRVFYSHNVHSLIGETDRSVLGQVLRRGALRFDRRWYADPDTTVVCISRADVDGLKRIGISRDDILVAPPGAPPAVTLQPEATVLAELVLTGSYGWWRKRRDLARFAEGPALPYPILANDPVALGLLGAQARPAPSDSVDWSEGLRFALITDRFQGGFKLKSVEYVALNGLLISFCDLSAEFEGLPHAQEFVRLVRSKAEAGAVVREVCAQPGEDVVARFRLFKAACLDRYQWERCLEPLAQAITGADVPRTSPA